MRTREERIRHAIQRGMSIIERPLTVRGYHPPSRSKYKPHQGARECERRRIGGFYTLRWSNMGERV